MLIIAKKIAVIFSLIASVYGGGNMLSLTTILSVQDSLRFKFKGTKMMVPSHATRIPNSNYILADGFFGKEVWIFDAEGNPFLKIGEEGQGPGEFIHISDLAATKENILILDGGQRKVHIYDIIGGWINSFFFPESSSRFSVNDSIIFLYHDYIKSVSLYNYSGELIKSFPREDVNNNPIAMTRQGGGVVQLGKRIVCAFTYPFILGIDNGSDRLDMKYYRPKYFKTLTKKEMKNYSALGDVNRKNKNLEFSFVKNCFKVDTSTIMVEIHSRIEDLLYYRLFSIKSEQDLSYLDFKLNIKKERLSQISFVQDGVLHFMGGEKTDILSRKFLMVRYKINQDRLKELWSVAHN